MGHRAFNTSFILINSNGSVTLRVTKGDLQLGATGTATRGSTGVAIYTETQQGVTLTDARGAIVRAADGVVFNGSVTASARDYIGLHAHTAAKAAQNSGLTGDIDITKSWCGLAGRHPADRGYGEYRLDHHIQARGHYRGRRDDPVWTRRHQHHCVVR